MEKTGGDDSGSKGPFPCGKRFLEDQGWKHCPECRRGPYQKGGLMSSLT